jgi:hypothetical protein
VLVCVEVEKWKNSREVGGVAMFVFARCCWAVGLALAIAGTACQRGADVPDVASPEVGSAGDAPAAAKPADPAAGHSADSSAATAARPPAPSEEKKVATPEAALQVASHYVAEEKLGWGAAASVDFEGGRYKVFFPTPKDEDRDIGPRFLVVSPEGEVQIRREERGRD